MEETSNNNKLEKEITIVTAFFDIGRKDFKAIPRTNEEYLKYFKVWGKMKNKLVVYTNKTMGEEIRKYRKEWNLLDKTTIIEIENEEEIEPDLLSKMKIIAEDEYFLNYRYITDATSNSYKYDYIMLLKYWCLQDAVKKGYADGMVAWVDFGFNHFDTLYTVPEEFNFLWKTNLSDDKIHLFVLGEEVIKKPIFHLVRTFEDNIMGCMIILPSKLCEIFWESVKHAMNTLIEVGFIDDDQLLLVMAYRANTELFAIHKSTWFMPLKENGAPHLTIKETVPKKENCIKKIIKKVKDKKWEISKERNYIKRVIKDIRK